MPSESFVWVSAFPVPRHGRLAGGSLPGRDNVSWPASGRACECRLTELCPPNPPTPQTGTNVQTAPTPVLTPATMHLVASPAPVRRALPWPGTTGTAEVSGPRGRSSPWSWAGCVRGIPEPGPRPGTHLRTWPVLAASDARQGVATPCFRWEFPAMWAADRRDSSARGAREPRRHMCGHPVPVVCTPAEPGHGLGGFPATPWPLPADWGWK